MRNRIHGIHGAALWNSFWKICAATAVMGAACYGSSHGLHAALGNKVRVDLLDVMVSIPLALVVFYAVARWLKIAELDEARQALLGPLARRFKFVKI
jgi:hypothetical protein